jgi:hypothetical protein
MRWIEEDKFAIDCISGRRCAGSRELWLCLSQQDNYRRSRQCGKQENGGIG